MPLDDLKVNIESRVTIVTHRVELGTRQPSGPPWSMPIGNEILIHDLTIQGHLGRLLSNSPLNQYPWKGNFFSCPSVANLPMLTQFHY